MVNHAGSSWVILAQLCNTNGSHQIIVAQLRPSLGSLGVSWLPSGVHMGILDPSCASLGSILGSLVPLLGPTWTVLDTLGHPEAPLSSSWSVLGFDGGSQGSSFTPQDRIQDQVVVIFRSRLIRVG